MNNFSISLTTRIPVMTNQLLIYIIIVDSDQNNNVVLPSTINLGNRKINKSIHKKKYTTVNKKEKMRLSKYSVVDVNQRYRINGMIWKLHIK